MRKPKVEPNSVFLNIPYDGAFQRLYLAYIAGLCALGLKPCATLEIPGGERRLDRIFDLIQSCRYSIHDLSRVQLDRTPPPTPRFNMPMELGMAIAWTRLSPGDHTWFVCETKPRRALKSISDLNGTDLNIHNGTIEGVMREICNAFVRYDSNRPSVPQMVKIYHVLRASVPELRRSSGAQSLFEARMFTDLCYAASDIAAFPHRQNQTS